MVNQLDFRTPAAPAVVMATLRTHAAYWAESVVPEELRRRGLLGVDAQIDGSRFRLVGQDLNLDPPALEYGLEGTVTQEVGGGSRVQVRLVLTKDQSRVPVALAVLGLLAMLWGHWLFGAILAGGGALVWRLEQQRRAGPVITADLGAAHLWARLELALEATRSGPSSSAV